MTLHPQGLEAEVNAYLTDVKSSNDIVKYWQDNQHIYLTIFKLTMNILPIEGTSVPLPELMETLQMLKFSLKQGQFLNFTTGMSKEDEVAVLEAMLTAEDSIPKDVEAY
ncbi:hypothetical protein ARMGADRAFT_1082211 [Armillaria gallica]|uniref:HAT C-terminal dimerisation domain-containing protein n=1 Tax=Armillaria gallica TaxID=47427 RepID=A0A2H3DPG8_ARMGA|nr:hypothetical protein ARMGADRAFT_1082211 [Armillaria gallica]